MFGNSKFEVKIVSNVIVKTKKWRARDNNKQYDINFDYLLGYNDAQFIIEHYVGVIIMKYCRLYAVPLIYALEMKSPS